MTEHTPFNAEIFTQDARRIWNEAATHYDEMSRRLFYPIAQTFLDFAQIKPGELILDVACGSGSATVEAAQHVGPSGKIVAVDLSTEMIKIAAKRCQDAGFGVSAVEFREMDATQLDFPDSIFDAAICQLGLMLFPKPGNSLREMLRVVKPQGRVSCLVQGGPKKMLFTSILNHSMIRHAPHLKNPGAPGLYDFAPDGVLDKAFADAGLIQIESRRIAGTFAFASIEEYWKMMSEGAGRTGVMLKSLEEPIRQAIYEDVFRLVSEFKTESGTGIPYEFVMCSGLKP